MRRSILTAIGAVMIITVSWAGAAGGPGATVQAAVLPDGEGKTAFTELCSGCHALEMAIAKRRSEADWRGVIESMVDRGATGTPEEFSAALAYLSRNFGPAAPAAPPQQAAQPQPAAGGQGRGGQPPQQQDPWAGKKKLLAIADVQSGFHHDSISHALAVIERIGRESGAYMTMIRTDSQLVTKTPIVGRGSRYTGRPINARNLDYFDAVFFLGSGEGTLTPEQKADLLSFVRDDGKGFVGGHASIIGFYDWPEFGELIGGFMDNEYPVADMPIVVDDPRFPGADAFPKAFAFADQFPVLKAPYAKDKIEPIMRLDASKMTDQQRARRADGDFPIVWKKSYGKGRVFYSSFGHPESSWDDPRVQKLYLEGIKWALAGTGDRK